MTTANDEYRRIGKELEAAQSAMRELGARIKTLEQDMMRADALGRPKSIPDWPPGVNPNWTCSGMENACEQEEGA